MGDFNHREILNSVENKGFLRFLSFNKLRHKKKDPFRDFMTKLPFG